MNNKVRQLLRLHDTDASSVFDMAAGSDDTSAGVNFIPGRARQLVHLTGYRLGVIFDDQAPGTTEEFTASVALQVSPSQISATGGMGWIDPTGVRTSLQSRLLIDLMQYSHKARVTTSGETVTPRTPHTGWVTCDLFVPAVHLRFAGFGTGSNDMVGWAIVEFEFVNASMAEIAATMFVYGLDPQDFEESATQH